jgi:hypothetical protein
LKINKKISNCILNNMSGNNINSFAENMRRTITA